MANRVTQLIIETVRIGLSKIRVTQYTRETVRAQPPIPPSHSRLTQEAEETLYGAAGGGRVSQETVETLYLYGGAVHAGLSQEAVEVAYDAAVVHVILTQEAIEILRPAEALRFHAQII